MKTCIDLFLLLAALAFALLVLPRASKGDRRAMQALLGFLAMFVGGVGRLREGA